MEDFFTPLWRLTYRQQLTVGHAARIDDAKMARERMTASGVAKELRALSERMAESFAQVDERFAQIDARFEQQRLEFHSDLEKFADDIKRAFNVSLEGMQAKLDAALDDTREQRRRLDLFERQNAEDHRLMQAQIDDLDSRLPPRRGGRRRPS